MNPPPWPPCPPPRPGPPTTPRPVHVVPAAPEEARYRAEGKHLWLTDEDAVLDRLMKFTDLYGPLKAAQLVFVEGEAA